MGWCEFLHMDIAQLFWFCGERELNTGPQDAWRHRNDLKRSLRQYSTAMFLSHVCDWRRQVFHFCNAARGLRSLLSVV